MQFFCSYHMITLSSSPLGILTSLDQIFHPLAINTFAQGDDDDDEEDDKYFDEEEESGDNEDNNFCISGNDENGIESHFDKMYQFVTKVRSLESCYEQLSNLNKY